mmetsp:Transcript_24822/g.43993  ORF Transcript_24822/g.43993 Transcript_24822/m.43993 type:complete len:506 (+) Transcript_24822:121-1638(+)
MNFFSSSPLFLLPRETRHKSPSKTDNDQSQNHGWMGTLDIGSKNIQEEQQGKYFHLQNLQQGSTNDLDDEDNMSEVNEDEQEHEEKGITNPRRPVTVPPSNRLASQSYLETSPTFRGRKTLSSEHKRRNNHTETAASSSSSTSTSSSASSSSSALAGYKSKVQQLIQQMEEQQARSLQQQDAKSIEFRRRMQLLVQNLGDPNQKGNEEDKEVTLEEGKEKTERTIPIPDEQTSTKHASLLSKDHTIKGRSDSDSMNQKNTRNSCHCTVSTTSITAAGSWSIASSTISPKSSTDLDEDEDFVVGELHPKVMAPPPQLQVVHVKQQKQSQRTASDTTIRSLEERLHKLEADMNQLESENEALLALRESYKRRFSFEKQQRSQLDSKIVLLKSYLEDTRIINQKLQKELSESKSTHREQEESHTLQKAEWQTKLDRVKRDMDRLWKRYKTSQTERKEALQCNQKLQEQIEEWRRKENKWEEEKAMLNDKIGFLQGQVDTMKGILGISM